MYNDEKLGGVIREEFIFWDFLNMVEVCKIKEMRFTGNILLWFRKRDYVWI